MHKGSETMRTTFLLVIGLSLLVYVSACSGSRTPEPEPALQPPQPAPSGEVSIVAQPGPDGSEPFHADPSGPVVYRSGNESPKEPIQAFDILHTTLDLSFDFQNARVVGSAYHRIASLSEGLRTVSFNARDMSVDAVLLRTSSAEFSPAVFQYANSVITVTLPAPMNREQEMEVFISYTAHPMRNGQNLGLVFVDPLGIDPSKPTQIWTLGQPEDNQYWFPTWDYPNDRMTFETALTVPNQLTTVSNGQLVRQEDVGNGMRKDVWVLEKPHAAYLTGFAIGEFSAVTDQYVRDDGSVIPLAYFVEPDHASDARLAFGETSAMMRFFEDRLGIAYPWSNYKQIAVRDFTARGMENTTATLLYEDIQYDERAQLDYTGRDLIAHELAHQWFGNLITCRNWGNLPLNEGFASYFERLYIENAVGEGEAQFHTIQDRNAYFAEAERMMRPIIWHAYEDPNDLFDRHTYQKTALVLHQLRYELGDEVWWRGVRQYLREHAYRSVVIEDLQRVMQQVSGQNLVGFFDQWFRRPGHPVLRVEHAYDESTGLYELHVTQLQDSLELGPFALDVNIEVNVQGVSPWTQQYRLASRDTTYRFAIAGAIGFVHFDEGDWALADIEVEKDLQEWLNQIRMDDEMAGRLDAARALANFDPTPRIRDALIRVLGQETSLHVREAVVQALRHYNREAGVRAALAQIVQQGPHSNVRSAALVALQDTTDAYLKSALDMALADQSYEVVAGAVEIYSTAYPVDAITAYRRLYDLGSWKNRVEHSLIEAYGRLGSVEGIPYLQKMREPIQDEEIQMASIDALSSIASQNPGVRSSVAQSLLNSLDSVHEPVRFRALQVLLPMIDSSQLSQLRARLQGDPSARIRQLVQNTSNLP